ncbi:alkaline phosphatase-like protein [Oleiphilus messinensis]|uniref:Alkaline phosphatase-like protein n=1 Tax=Oleiphilus messinensis TaxID=141451 RepID=A0A1Y0I602_9GAMM|nr:esterase-like activity of phytase family protein [Oleiphilus messinensis]ARU54965.1 alkaline phosphatase-like protein [Oleiphilus messinensis]
MRVKSPSSKLALSGQIVAASLLCLNLTACNDDDDNNDTYFNRVSTFPICQQIDSNCNTDETTVAEIVAASSDGMTLIYTDSQLENLGFVDISDPANPKPMGTVALSGEPTSVAVNGDYALAAINTSENFVNVSGELAVINVPGQNLVTTIQLGGQPDSIAVSPDKSYAVVVIENERDEDLGEGIPPQMPAGGLIIIDMQGEPGQWTTRSVDMTGLAAKFPEDPEPEYVDINADNVAVITLQENNHIVLVNLVDGSIVNHFSAGTVNLTQIDTTEEDPALISLTETQNNIPREPDGVTWLSTELFATADEGDMDGGSRGFTIFNTAGEVVYAPGNALEHVVVSHGHYPDARSGNKGNEPENVDFGKFGGKDYLFVASERSSVVFVYDIDNASQAQLKQVLPASVAPEGLLALPSRNLLIAASEEDARGDKIRSALNIYQYNGSTPAYPTIKSTNRADGTPIPWSALSGLAADPNDNNVVYSIQDSFYQQSRIFKLDVSQKPAMLVEDIVLKDVNDVLASLSVVQLDDAQVAADDDTRVSVFDEADLAAMINSDKTVNLDPEGIAVASDGGFWVASEGSGTMGETNRPINSLNMILKTSAAGTIERVITLPEAVNAVQLRFGFEGVTEADGKVYVAFQRAWNGEDNARIGIFDLASSTWSFLFYPLDPRESQAGGWVGLSDLTALGNGEFLVLERDNQGGPDAAIKRLYRINLSDLNDGDVISKTLVDDLMDNLAAAGGHIPEKIEGAAVLGNGDVLIVNDNDGVDDSSGETQLINLGNIL